METEQNEPHFESFGAFLGFQYRHEGRDFVEALLAAMVENGDTPREQLELAAAELRALRVNKVAALVAEAAAQCPPMTDLLFCAYMEPPYTNDPVSNELNIKIWLRGQERLGYASGAKSCYAKLGLIQTNCTEKPLLKISLSPFEISQLYLLL